MNDMKGRQHSPPKWENRHGKHIKCHCHVDNSIRGVEITSYVRQGSYFFEQVSSEFLPR